MLLEYRFKLAKFEQFEVQFPMLKKNFFEIFEHYLKS